VSKLVIDISIQQFDDGLWDNIHTLNSDLRANLTTENAIRRLLMLGLRLSKV